MKKSFFYSFVALAVFSLLIFGIFQMVTIKKVGFDQLAQSTAELPEVTPVTAEETPSTGGGVLPPREGSTDTGTALDGIDIPSYADYLEGTGVQPNIGPNTEDTWNWTNPRDLPAPGGGGYTVNPQLSSYAYPSAPPVQTPQNIPLLDQIVPLSSIDVNGQPLNNILNQLFYIGLVLAVILAIVMIIRGGLEYMTIDAISSKENGKSRVKAALGGLLLAFSAILILNTINPGLTSLNIVLSPLMPIQPGVSVGVPSGVPLTSGGTGTSSATQDVNGNITITRPNGTTQTLPAGSSEAEVRAYFERNGISINAAQGTTNVEGLGQSAMLGLVDLKTASGGTITITGGTEDGHQTHGVGIPIVDLRKESYLDFYITNNAVSVNSEGSYPIYTHRDGTTYMNEGDHWHVKFK